MYREPLPRTHATLVDLLDRVLDRGLIINADIVISLSGVPLIGINLRAAIAGMETMVQYGVMVDWDQSIRALEQDPRAPEASTLVGDGASGERRIPSIPAWGAPWPER